MVNSSAGYPPYEGKIVSNPDTGDPYDVTIPFFGVQPDDGATLLSANGGTLDLENTADITNPTYLDLASFSSWGPRSGGFLKPEVTAPGVSVDSAGMGTGNGPVRLRHVDGDPARRGRGGLLVKQAHPDWRRVVNWNDAIANTADPSLVAGFNVLEAGSGLVQAWNATHTQVTALGPKDTTSLDFGLYSDDKDFQGSQQIKLHNWGSTPVTFNVAASSAGSPSSINVNPASVTIPARGDKNVQVSLSVPIASAGDASTFNSVSGLVTFTPASGSDNSGIALHVPYLLVPQASSDLQLQHVDNGQFNPKKGQTTVTAPVTLTNNHGASDSIADWFAWGLKDNRSHGLGSDDLQAAGVQSFPGSSILFFAISTAHRWSNPAENEFVVHVDTNGDGIADYDVVAIDDGILFANGVPNGQEDVAVFNDHTGDGTVNYVATANFNGSTMELPVDFSQLGLTAASGPISYTVESFSQTDGSTDSFTGSATYDVNHPAFSNNGRDDVLANTTASDPTTVDLTQWAATPQLGLLVFDQNDTSNSNKNEATEIQLKINTHNH